MERSKKGFWAISLLIVTGLMLAACGDTATPLATSAAAGNTGATAGVTGAMTTTGATTSGAMTSSGTAMASGTPAMAMTGTAMTGGAMTTGAMTSSTAMMTSSTAMASGTPAMTGGAMMTGGTAMASGTAMMTSGAMMGNTANFPAISDATVVPADNTVAPALATQLGTVGIKPTGIQFYVSDDDSATLAKTADTSITGKGYKFNLPGFSSPITLPGTSNTLGIYNQTGQPDLLMLIAAVPTDTTKVGSTFLLPGIDSSTSQQIVNNLKGHKTAMILMTGTNLQQAIITLVTGAAKSITPGAVMTGGSMMSTAASGAGSNGNAPTSGATGGVAPAATPTK